MTRANGAAAVCCLFVASSVAAAPACGRAEDPAAADNRAAADDFTGRLPTSDLARQGFVPLFDAAPPASPSAASPLAAWDVKPWHEGHWVARDGVIDYDGRAASRRAAENSLWTKESFGDCVLYAEWRLPTPPAPKPHPVVLFNGDFLLDDAGERVTRPRPDAGDSGVLFRGTPKCQANIWSQELGSGEINGYRTDRAMPPEVRRAAIPLRRADRPAGEWNAFLMTLRGDEMTVVLNGETVVDAARLPGLPEAGPIGLQHHGDPVRFRRVWVRRL